MKAANLFEIKHRVRKLKKSELAIRFGGNPNTGATLVWDSFFDLHNASTTNAPTTNAPTTKARYSLAELSSMARSEYKDVIAEFFANVYYMYYLENGISTANLYSPSLLEQLGLPFDSEKQDIKKRFRELAMTHHPDKGGDTTEFIKLMQIYEELI